MVRAMRILLGLMISSILMLTAAACGGEQAPTPSTAPAPAPGRSPGVAGPPSAERTLRVGYAPPASHPYGLALERFADSVRRRSAGRMQIALVQQYAGGDDVALLDDLRAGRIDAGSVSATVWQAAGVDSFLALQMPFLITDYAIERAVLASPVATDMLRGTQSIGLTGLAIHEGGLRKPASAEGCLLAPDDWRGVTMRSGQSELLAESIRALGAEPTAMPLSEVEKALEAGQLDAIEANLGLVYSRGYYRVLRCMTGNVNLWPFPTVLAVNDDAWEALTPAEQKWMTAAAGDLADDSLDILTDPASTVMGDLCRAAEGFFFFGTATPAERAALRASVQPVYDQYLATEPTDGFIRRIERIKASVPAPPVRPYPPGCSDG